MTLLELKSWVLAAALLASHGTKHMADRVAEAIAAAALANPIQGDAVKAASVVVSLAWFESSFSHEAIGDGGASFCFGQINLPNGARTLEGWSGPELAADPVKCATVTLRIAKASIAAAPSSPPFLGLVVYARGPTWRNKCIHRRDGKILEEACNAGEEPIAVSLSKHRLELADRLVREVKP